ncbi:MAG: sulfotransferase domain-containing protein [Alphaproteobacteria bacterium]|nr:sulfotransferase domain-containing protein [Alphaproteobacteria bacterium]
MPQNKPDFFIIGAPKCGTTTLYEWLRTHPDIFMPAQKEPHFFAQNLSDRYCRVRDEKSYLELFSWADKTQICGESSVLYSFYPESIRSILKFNREAKIIFMLRNPVHMAPSYHAQLLVNLEEDVKNFEKAWNLQGTRQNGNKIPKSATDPDLLNYHKYCALGQHLKNALDIVPAAQLHIITLDDLAEAPQKTYEEALAFLELKSDNRQDFTRANEQSALRSTLLQKLRHVVPPKFRHFIKKFIPHTVIERMNRTKKIRKTLSPVFEQKLHDVFEGDIRLIENLLGRDLPHWYKKIK